MSAFDIRTSIHPNIPDVTLNDASNRRIKVLCVGAGVNGINNTYKIQKQCENIDLVVYEKNSDIGGTWLDNRYPGCACDVPSHTYAFHFAPNPFWPKFLSGALDIWTYLNKVCQVFKLRKYMKFDCEVTQACWDDTSSRWVVDVKRVLPGGAQQEFQDTCDFFIYAPGLLNKPQWPRIEGIDTFKGRLIHTARWPSSYQKKQWKNDKVAITGSGASSIQVVPNIQPYVSQLHAVWFSAGLVPGFPQEHNYSPDDIKSFRKDPQRLVDHQKLMEQGMNDGWSLFFRGHETQNAAKRMLADRMKEMIKDPKLLEVLCWMSSDNTSDPYVRAIQEPNVNVHFAPVVKLTPTGLMGGDGSHEEVDTVICATGFDASFTPRFPVIGRGGLSLAEKLGNNSVVYFGFIILEMPNVVMYGGPGPPVQNGSLMGVFDAMSNYATQMIQKLQLENELIKQTVFADNYRSCGLHYMEMLSEIRWEDYGIEYRDKKNMFAFIGTGYVRQHRKANADLAWYLTPEGIDTLWAKEIGLNDEECKGNSETANGEIKGEPRRC
ncbi:related to monooxigenase [Phialocephala subalpina]|uniref:Related to monooxigenase n=1 Tax=Phialocephala subalpina TaxID=576137 RepID=A0A1L7XPY4_9HELO|nr:related to monooxigenase [Phialocephala subalpina]